MARDTTPNNEPHLSQNADGLFYVRIKEPGGNGWTILSEPSGRLQAKRELRRIREEMVSLYMLRHESGNDGKLVEAMAREISPRSFCPIDGSNYGRRSAMETARKVLAIVRACNVA